MTLIWNLFCPLILYDFTTVLCRYFLALYGDLFVQMVSAAITAWILGIFYRKKTSFSIKDFQGRIQDPALSLFLVICLILAGVSSGLFLNHLMELTGLRRWFSGYESVAKTLFSPSIWIQIVSMGLVIPAAEELIFRGFVFRALRETYSFLIAAVVSSLIFGIYHGNVTQAIYACGIAMLLSWCYEQCGTILAPWLVHGSANLFAILGENKPAGGTMMISGLLLVLSVWGIRTWVHEYMKKQ